MKNTQLVAPALIVVSIFAIYLSLTYLPLASWGISIDSGSLWLYLPWILVFATGLFVLKEIYRRR